MLGLLLAASAWGQQRLDLRVGHGLDGLPNPETDGYRIYLDGRLMLQVSPGGNDVAVVSDPASGRRTIALPEVAPRRVEFTSLVSATSGPVPDFITKDFSTFYDGLALLLDGDTEHDWPPWQRFSARVTATTDAGKVGHSRLTVIARAERLTDATLDGRIERFINADPLPPLAWGTAVCDLEILLTGAERPLLTVWIGRPYPLEDPAAAPLSGGTLYQRPLGLPRAVTASRPLAATLAQYDQDRRASRDALLRLLDQPEAPPLYGTWRPDTAATGRAVAELLQRLPAGEADPALFLQAWTLAHEKRAGPAAAAMRQAALGSDDPRLAAEARLLCLHWQNSAESAGETGDLELEIRLAEQAATALTPDNALPQLAQRLQLLRRVETEATQRFDQQWIQRALIGDAARALAAAGDREEPIRADPALRQWLAKDNPPAEWLLYDAALLLFEKGRPRNAAVLLSWLAEDYPFSTLAPEARRRLAGWLPPEQGAALYRELAADLAPASSWRQQWDRVPPPVWSATIRSRLDGPEEIRADAWRRLRDHALTDGEGQAVDLSAAAEAAQQLSAITDSRTDRLLRADLLFTLGDLDQARQIYAALAADETDDALRRAALTALAATLHPDARRVAKALRQEDDAGFLEGLAPAE